jgi:hypothetical protein
MPEGIKEKYENTKSGFELATAGMYVRHFSLIFVSNSSKANWFAYNLLLLLLFIVH